MHCHHVEYIAFQSYVASNLQKAKIMGIFEGRYAMSSVKVEQP